MTALSFTVPGDLVPKAREKIGRRRDGKPIAYTPPRTKSYKTVVARCALAARQRVKRAGVAWPMDAAYRVVVVVVRSTAQRFDADRALNAILDALTGVLYEDDRSRFVCDARVIVADVDASNPRTLVIVEVITAESVRSSIELLASRSTDGGVVYEREVFDARPLARAWALVCAEAAVSSLEGQP